MFKKSKLLSSSIIATAILAVPAYAQVDDEIIVTATKRQTTLQDTPVAVSVTSAATIEKAQILDILDLQSVVPSLKVTQLQTSNNTNFIIRGFGNGANNAGIEPSVGVFIDGVYRSRSAAQIGDLPKLERVEVLKGPQSTLFGKNASAGVISVVSAKPSFTGEGYAEIGVTNYDGRLLRAYASGPLSDTVAVSLGGSFFKRDGYAESQVEGVDDFNDRDRFSLRGQMLFEPTDALSMRVIADLSRIDENCCTVTNIQNQGAAAIVSLFGGRANNDLDPFAYETFLNRNAQNKVDDMGLSFHVDYDLDWAALTSITSYRENESSYNQDADYNTLELLRDVNNFADIRTFTQELRLTSQGDGPLSWMAGAYFFNEKIDQIGGLEWGNDIRPFFNALLSAGGIPFPDSFGTLEGIYGVTPGSFFGGGQTTTETFTQDNQAWSAFTTLDYEISDKLTATVGLNYTDDSKDVMSNVINNDIWGRIDLNNDTTLFGVALPQVLFGQFFQAGTGLAPTPANIGFIESVAPGTSAGINGSVAAVIGGLQGTQFQPQFLDYPNSVEGGSSNDDKLTYVARLAYEVNDNLNLYGSYSTGFKSTSWNLSRDSRPLPADAAALTAAGLAQPNQSFGTRFAGPEEARVIEFGLKAKLPRGAINVAVFDQSIKGFQSNIFTGTGFALANAGEQSTKGAEIDITYTPIDPFTLTFAGTWLDPIYDEFDIGVGPNGPGLTGETPAGIPNIAFSTSGTYNHDFENGMTGFMRADFQYQDPTNILDAIVEFTPSDGQTQQLTREIKTVNASMGLNWDNGVSLQFWARNLFNDEYFLSAFPGVAQEGVIQAYPVAPRTYGANLRWSF